jgi:hypothetical protein
MLELDCRFTVGVTVSCAVTTILVRHFDGHLGLSEWADTITLSPKHVRSSSCHDGAKYTSASGLEYNLEIHKHAGEYIECREARRRSPGDRSGTLTIITKDYGVDMLCGPLPLADDCRNAPAGKLC